MTSESYMSGKANTAIVDSLRRVLADTFVLYFKTHSFHWNVEGPHFKSLHELFETQYNELWAATDVIAERIRTLDSYAPVSWSEMVKFASLQETGQMPDAAAMIDSLANDNGAIVEKTLYPALHAAQAAGDEATIGLIIDRIDIHEKTTWMLRSSAKGM